MTKNILFLSFILSLSISFESTAFTKANDKRCKQEKRGDGRGMEYRCVEDTSNTKTRRMSNEEAKMMAESQDAFFWLITQLMSPVFWLSETASGNCCTVSGKYQAVKLLEQSEHLRYVYEKYKLEPTEINKNMFDAAVSTYQASIRDLRDSEPNNPEFNAKIDQLLSYEDIHLATMHTKQALLKTDLDNIITN